VIIFLQTGCYHEGAVVLRFVLSSFCLQFFAVDVNDSVIILLPNITFSLQRSWSFRGHKNNLEKIKKKLYEQVCEGGELLA